MALVGGSVCIDRWEASIVIREDGKEHDHSPYEPIDYLDHYRAVSRGGVIPQGYISGKEAEVACQASGKRLCTPTEWERGCRGPDHLQFPYGNERRARVCNDDARKDHPVMEAAAKMHIPKEQMWSKGMNLAIINQLPDTLLKTGERNECVTPEGLYDMVGNLHEWVADSTFHGGYYMDTTQNGDGCSYQTSAHAFGYHDYSTGFRCCSDPDPIE
jgi:sulfatase modifying factor 1